MKQNAGEYSIYKQEIRVNYASIIHRYISINISTTMIAWDLSITDITRIDLLPVLSPRNKAIILPYDQESIAKASWLIIPLQGLVINIPLLIHPTFFVVSLPTKKKLSSLEDQLAMRQDSKTAAITVSSAAMSSQGLKVHRPLIRSLQAMSCTVAPINIHKPGQITIIPKPELRGFWGHFPY